MDLALYAVSAVLVEGRSVREVAAATEDGTHLRHLTLDPKLDYQPIRQTSL